MDNLIIAGKTFASRRHRRHRQIFVAGGHGAGARSVGRRHDHRRRPAREHLAIARKESLLDYIDTSKYFLLPNTAGCYTADEAVRTARLDARRGCRTG